MTIDDELIEDTQTGPQRTSRTVGTLRKLAYGMIGIVTYLAGTYLSGYNTLNMVPNGGNQKPGFVDPSDLHIEDEKGETIFYHRNIPYKLKLDPQGNPLILRPDEKGERFFFYDGGKYQLWLDKEGTPFLKLDDSEKNKGLPKENKKQKQEKIRIRNGQAYASLLL